jgi:hypothetical protein
MSDDDYQDHSTEYSRGQYDYHSGAERDWTSASHSSGWDEAARYDAANRAHNESQTESQPDPVNVSFGKTAGAASGAGGGGAILALVLLTVLAAALPAAVLAVPAAFLAAWPLVFLSSLGGLPLRFGKAWRLGYSVVAWYAGLALWVGIVIVLVGPQGSWGGLDWIVWHVKDFIGRAIGVDGLPRGPAQPETTTLLLTLALMQAPGLLAGGRILQRHIQHTFGGGMLGFLRATGAAVILLPVCSALAGVVLYFLLCWADVAKFASFNQFLTLGAVTCFLCVSYALLSGVVLASVATCVLRSPKERLWPGFRAGFAAIFQALFGFALSTAVAILLFRQGDPLLRWAFTVVRSNDALTASGLLLGPLWSSFWEAFLLLIPGALIAGATVAARMGRTTKGAFASLGVYAVAGALALLSLPPALLAMAYVLAVRTDFLARL